MEKVDVDYILLGTNKRKIRKNSKKINNNMTVADVMNASSFDRLSKINGDELLRLVYAVGNINQKSIKWFVQNDFECFST